MPKLIITNNACGLALMNIFDIQTFLVFFTRLTGARAIPVPQTAHAWEWSHALPRAIMERTTRRLACDLSQLQNVIKRDPNSYLEEVNDSHFFLKFSCSFSSNCIITQLY